MPQRIQLRRTKGWRLPAGAIVVSRPTKWGNPFTLWTVPDAVELYRRWLAGEVDRAEWERRLAADKQPLVAQLKIGNLELKRTNILNHIAQLRDSDLACWCPLDKPCHADVLLELANR